jgi:hypothetical protein
MTETKWKDRIENLIANPGDSMCAMEARRLASSWTTCGIGESRAMLREKGYQFDDVTQYPTNEVLKSLGNRFHAHIDHGRYESAMDYLRKIEALGPCADIGNTR